MVTWCVLTGCRMLMVVFSDLEVGLILILSCLFNLSQWDGLYHPLLVTAVHSYWKESHIFCFYYYFLTKTENYNAEIIISLHRHTHFSLWASRSRQKSSEVQTVIRIPNIPSTSGMARNACIELGTNLTAFILVSETLNQTHAAC